MTAKREPYIKVPRKLFRDVPQGGAPEWNERRRFSKWEALVYLYSRASYEDGRIWTLTNGARITLSRGETPPLALTFLAQAWRWSKGTVDDFLRRKIEERAIATGQTFREGRTLRLLFYDDWDGERDARPDEDWYAEVVANAEDIPTAPDEGSDASPDGTPDAHRDEMKTGRRRKSNRRTPVPLPDDFAPTPEHARIATEDGIDLEREVVKFRRWSIGKTRADWNRAFTNWLGNAGDFEAKRTFRRPAVPEYNGNELDWG